jgi:glycosyltransferase involved in cell wall biosynthesis
VRSQLAIEQNRNSEIKKRRILVIPSEYPDLKNPLEFYGSWAEEQTRALACRHDVSVVYPIQSPGMRSFEKSDYYGVPTMIVRYRHVRKTWITPYLWAAWQGVKVMTSVQVPECIHAHGIYPAGLAAVLIGHRLGIPAVVTEHWGQLPVRLAESRLLRAAVGFTLKRATRIVAVSDFLAREIRAIESKAQLEVAPNIVDSSFFARKPPRGRSAKPDARFLFVGSLRDTRKGLNDLLPALRQYSDLPCAIPFSLAVIGDGGLKEEFQRTAYALDLGDRVLFLGNRSRGEVASAMEDCDVYMMPSRYETFGVVYAEAMACGKPVIACSGGPAEEIVPPWAGAFASPGNVSELARAIAHVVANLPHYERDRIIAYARSSFGEDAVVKAISGIYERAISDWDHS